MILIIDFLLVPVIYSTGDDAVSKWSNHASKWVKEGKKMYADRFLINSKLLSQYKQTKS